MLPYLYARIGFECGRFAHLLHRVCGVSWGTYADAMCHDSQLHCNAHSNNMVLVPERQASDDADAAAAADADADAAADATSAATSATHAASVTAAGSASSAASSSASAAPLAPSADSNYLAFLDLDMAFDRASYVDASTGAVGMAADAHRALLQLEHANFAEVCVRRLRVSLS